MAGALHLDRMSGLSLRLFYQLGTCRGRTLAPRHTCFWFVQKIPRSLPDCTKKMERTTAKAAFFRESNSRTACGAWRSCKIYKNFPEMKIDTCNSQKALLYFIREQQLAMSGVCETSAITGRYGVVIALFFAYIST